MMSQNLAVEEFTTPDPVTASEEAGVEELRALMEQHGVRHVPVLRGNSVVGVVSERDVRIVLGLPVEDIRQVRASDLMAADPLTVTAATPLDQVAHAMSESKVGSAIVNDEEGRLLGIFTASDALNALIEVVRGEQG
ncbi:CBS domain-containing protein [Thioalkalivibrio sp. ALJ24]|uniref:CBS domain-containing protein n=1 Tax=Thioalkalivibrio sp. ALJ24 TaxID=545276 RepID=UPI00035DA5BB|nr:CBS domain-containing protein [Thioalkalivibrio sp. ALJ24]